MLFACQGHGKSTSKESDAGTDDTGLSNTPLATSSAIVNMSRLEGDSPLLHAALFWFGSLSLESNYADGRIGFDDTGLQLHLTAFDFKIWYDENPSIETLEQWDAFSVYLASDTDGVNRMRFVGQFAYGNDSSGYQQAYAWNGSDWETSSTSYTIETGYRSSGLNRDDAEASGWNLTLTVPYASLGLSAAPDTGSEWHMAVLMHDRDSGDGPALEPKGWPYGVDVDDPSSWGVLRFGMPTYSSSPSNTGTEYEIYEGLDGQHVVDAHVGGSSDCGGVLGTGEKKFSEWGDLNYAGSIFLNVQNQWDVADSGCFSKVYLRFNLGALPADKVVQHAELRMHHFGNSLPSEAPDSYIQVHTTAAQWDEQTITWNNAPSAIENLSGVVVQPLPAGSTDVVAYEWDASRAVAASYEEGSEVALVLYSGDGPRHTGKYFTASDGSDGNPFRRPALLVTLADP
ncbi:MAG: DNRLRE domain-containing protein [Myxococcales bacterium]|nr:MAG: DNRLRE domain-containing protein [Myxococcales bacterium]